MRTFRQIIICVSVAISLLGGKVQAAPQANVTAFLANPAQALASNPNGGGALISLIRDAAIADPTALPAIIALLNSASAQQQSAIGAGLGQAAMIVGKTDQAYASQIQQAVAASGAESAIGAFATATGDVNVGAIGGDGGNRTKCT